MNVLRILVVPCVTPTISSNILDFTRPFCSVIVTFHFEQKIKSFLAVFLRWKEKKQKFLASPNPYYNEGGSPLFQHNLITKGKGNHPPCPFKSHPYIIFDGIIERMTHPI